MLIFKKKEILFLVIAFLMTSFLAKFYLDKFDDYKSYQNQNHPMIKSAVENHWGEANRIVQDIRAGKSIFKSGSYQEDEFLTPKLLAMYYVLVDKDMYLEDLVKTDNGKFIYLIIKNFLYFFFLFIFFKIYKNLI